jgi:hypothetical protein
MKKAILFFGLAFLVGSLNSCKKYKNKEVYANVPVYMDYDSFRNSFSFQQGVPMTAGGNIFVHNNFIFVSEEDKGIHVVDNSDPYYPYSMGFMNIPGNTQMAVDGHYLYANSFIDLLVIDISNINDPKEVARHQDAFSYSTPVANNGYPVADIYTDRGVVVDWTIEKTKEVSGFMNKYNVADCEDCDQSEVQTKFAASRNVNLSGSMAKFAMVDDYLYALDKGDLKSFNMSNPTSPVFGHTKRTFMEPESILSSGYLLFVGTTTGMVIYNTESNRDRPTQVSEIEHVESCDPVAVHGDYAYLTLRSGSNCGGEVNEFQVIDISNKFFPKHKESYDMYDPHGLGVDNDLLFICDGDDGLKIFDASSPVNSGQNMLYHFPSITSTDIILNNGIAVLIGDDGVFQYDYSNPNNLEFLSMLYF